MIHQYPETITFSLYRKKGQVPTIVIRRDGSLGPKNPVIKVRHVTVLLVEGPKGGRTRSQYKAMVQLVRVALQQYSLAKITFEEGASPWANDYLPSYNEKWTTVPEAMRMRSTTYDKVLMRK